MASRGLILVTGVLVVGLVPNAAGAAPSKRGISGGGYRYVSTTETVGENLQDGNEVVCPGDEPVVGGGVFADGSYAQRFELNTSRPYDADADERLDDGWTAYVDNINSDGAAGDFTVYAICDKRAAEGAYRYRATASVPSPEGSQVGASAHCPNDEPGVSGGVSSSGFLNDEMHINTSRPFDDGDRGTRLDDGWSLFVDNETVGNIGQFIVGFVICDKRNGPDEYVYKSASETAMDDSQELVTRACPGDTRLVGGGMRSSGAYEQRMLGVANNPFDAGGSPALDTWVAGVNNLNGGGDFQSLTAYAVCRR